MLLLRNTHESRCEAGGNIPLRSTDVLAARPCEFELPWTDHFRNCSVAGARRTDEGSGSAPLVEDRRS